MRRPFLALVRREEPLVIPIHHLVTRIGDEWWRVAPERRVMLCR